MVGRQRRMATLDYVVTGVSAVRAGSDGGSWTWRVAAGSAAVGAVVYPTLPPTIFDFNFRGTDTLGIFEAAAVAAPGGYDAARPRVFDTADASWPRRPRTARRRCGIGHGGHAIGVAPLVPTDV